tara:strand:+ start:243 stop:623 length:381 start_codon:yes stop_codon:yes gene_type:complete
MRRSVRPRIAIVAAAFGAALVVLSAQENDVELRTVIGCLSQDGNTWTLVQATPGEPTRLAFTSREELDSSRVKPLGSLTYRLLGVQEFDIAPHLGHKVQAKGLRISGTGRLGLNVTSFQHLDPVCE